MYQTPSGLPAGVTDRMVSDAFGDAPDEHMGGCPSGDDPDEDCVCRELYDPTEALIPDGWDD